ncbi:T9SS type B sorting domain-containing protein [Flavobacterium sp. GCM10027622]|uniref:T9SS type B sorting domain-containing protein n=1 Tax=unclassified Flavobacterium TaxID=196869 RepID=UPI003621B6FF
MKIKLLVLFLSIVWGNSFGQNAPTVYVNTVPPLPVCAPGDATTLQADFLQTYATNTNNYTVTSIPFAPAYSFTSGEEITTTNNDDVWSRLYELPFPFCFYGVNYTHILIGSNGIISFNIHPSVVPGGIPGGTELPNSTDVSSTHSGCDWSFSSTLPTTNPTTFREKNAIYGVYQDTDIRTPPVTNPAVQRVRFYTTGTYPNRAFVANFNELPQFSCGSGVGLQTSQIILYETTNTIDVLVKNRTPCTGWQSGVGVIGVMNQSGTLAAIPPGRNTGAWSATNEAWRFTPSAAGGSNVSIEWFNGATSLGPGVSGGTGINNLTVNVSGPTTYTAVATYTRCDGTQVVIQDDVSVDVEGPLPTRDPQNIVQCGTPPFNINQNVYMLNGYPAADFVFKYYVDNAGAPGTQIPNASLSAYVPVSPTYPQTIWVEVIDQNTTGCSNFRSFTIDLVASPSGTFSYADPFCDSVSTPQNPTLNALTSNGTFSATPAGLIIDPTSGAITPEGSTPGTYTVSYFIAASGTCPSYSAPSVSVTINPGPVLVITDPAAVCEPATVDITAPAVTAGSTVGGTLSYWTDVAATNALTNPNAVATSGTYYIMSTVGACSDIEPVTVTINPSPSLVITNPAAVCAPTTVDLTDTAVTTGSTGGGTLSYWTDAAATSPLANPNAVATSGTYYIMSTLGSCTDIEPVTVTINPTPSLVITNPAAVCAPTTVDLTAAAVTVGSTGSGTLSYWTDAAATAPLASPNAVATSGTYYIMSTVGTCSDIEAVTVTINPTPSLVITNPAAVCVPATVDLTAAAVTTGSTGSGTLSYWTDAAATTPLTNPNAVATSGTYYIMSTVGSCTDIEPVTVTVSPSPVLVITNPAAVCAPSTIDLTAAAVTAGSTGSGTLSYWTDAAATAPLASPNAVATSGTYYIMSTVGTCSDIEAVTVTINPTPSLVITNPAAVCVPATVDLTAAAVTTGSTGSGTLSYWTDATATTPLANPNAVAISGTYYIMSTLGTCTDIEPVTVTVSPSPVLVITNPAAVCEPSTVDLTAAAVTAGSTGSGTLTYWTNAAATTALATPSAVAIGGTYYIKSTVGTCSDIESVTVTVNPTPSLVITNPAAVCVPATVDLTAAAVTTGSTGSGTLSYWTDATATTPLVNPNAVATSGTYYIRSTVGSCTDIEPVTVTVSPSPVLVITNPAAVCAPSTIDLTAAAVTAGSTGSGTLSYWTNAAATTALASPNAVATSGTYYIKSTVGTCSDIEAVTVTVNPTPSLVITNPAAVCVPATVDLTALAVTAGSTGNGTLSYWTDAAATTPLANPNAVATSGTYYIRSAVGSCTDIEPVTVTVSPSPVLVITNPAAVCEPSTVDLTAAAVTAGSTGSGTLTYWTNAAATTALATPSAVAIGGTYYIKSTVGTCSDIKPVTVTINAIPVVSLDGGYVCVDSATGTVLSTLLLDSQLSATDYTFVWKDDQNNTVGTQSTYLATAPGTYSLVATTIAAPFCSTASASATVQTSSSPESLAFVTSNYFAETLSIEVIASPTGNYEYQLDNGQYQSSNVFTGVTPGAHIVSVRDIHNVCSPITGQVDLVDFPRYFTPNGDGIHDVWNIGFLNSQSNSKIEIFDRMGKLLKVIYPSGQGWDGTYLDQPLPSTDYWFVVHYEENAQQKVFRGHFAMKR